MDPEETNNTEEMVEIHEASVDDLDAALKNATEVESSESAPEPEVAPESENPSGESAPEAGADGSPLGAEASKPVQKMYSQEEIQAILAENEKNKQSLDKKELFIQHRGNELGKLRQEVAAHKQHLAMIREKLVDGLEDRFNENPLQAIADREKITGIDRQLEELDAREERATRIVEAQTFFTRHIDTEKVTLDDVAAVLKADGIADQYIAAFKANPWEFTTPEALVQMGKRAQDRQELTKADNDRRILARAYLEQKKELEQLRGRPAQVINQVQRQLNQAPMNVTSASSVSPKATRDLDPTRMSIQELDAALRNATSH